MEMLVYLYLFVGLRIGVTMEYLRVRAGAAKQTKPGMSGVIIARYLPTS